MHADHLGTPQMLTDDTGAVVWDASYRPFGEASVTGSVAFNLRFPGQYYDAETGLHYNMMRDYDSGLGRCVQSDPVGLAGGWNTYAYVGGNPVIGADVLGLELVPLYAEISASARVPKFWEDTHENRAKFRHFTTSTFIRGELPPCCEFSSIEIRGISSYALYEGDERLRYVDHWRINWIYEAQNGETSCDSEEKSCEPIYTVPENKIIDGLPLPQLTYMLNARTYNWDTSPYSPWIANPGYGRGVEG